MKTIAIKSTIISISTAFILLSPSSFAQDYYKWVDSKGSTHYTKTPPPASAKKKAKVETYGWKNSAPTSSGASTSNEVPSDVVKATEEAKKAVEESKPINIPQIPESNLPK